MNAQAPPKSVKCIYLIKDKSLQVQIDNINAINTITNILSTCLGPRSLQKMILTRIGTIQITNDGNAILRELDITHPAAKQVVELARTQDNEVGDGTTSVILLTGKLLEEMGYILKKGHHPVHIAKILKNTLFDCLDFLHKISFPFEGTEKEKIDIIRHSIANKLCTMLKVDLSKMAYKAVHIAKNTDIKTFVRIEKISDPDFTKTELIEGVIVNKSLIHSQMRREIENPRIVILDTPLEYKKGESKTTFEFKNQGDFARALEIEEEQIRESINHILSVNPDIVISEKGISDSAFSIFQKHNITALRRFKKTEILRLSAVTGATILSRAEDIEEKHVGTNCGLFKITRMNNEDYCNFLNCKNAKACTVLLKGPSKDILNEFERNFEDAIKVARNLKLSNRLCYGGGATEMNLSKYLLRKLKNQEKDNSLKNPKQLDLQKKVIEGVSNAFRIIPQTLLNNSGCDDPLDIMAQLETCNDIFMGVDGIKGNIVDVRNLVMEPIAVKKQIIESAFETVISLLRVDGVIKSKN